MPVTRRRYQSGPHRASIPGRPPTPAASYGLRAASGVRLQLLEPVFRRVGRLGMSEPLPLREEHRSSGVTRRAKLCRECFIEKGGRSSRSGKGGARPVRRPASRRGVQPRCCLRTWACYQRSSSASSASTALDRYFGFSATAGAIRTARSAGKSVATADTPIKSRVTPTSVIGSLAVIPYS